MKNPKTIAIAVAAVLIVVIVLQNTATVETRVLFFTVAMPRAVLLLVTLLVGFVVGLFVQGRLSKKDEPAGSKSGDED